MKIPTDKDRLDMNKAGLVKAEFFDWMRSSNAHFCPLWQYKLVCDTDQEKGRCSCPPVKSFRNSWNGKTKYGH